MKTIWRKWKEGLLVGFNYCWFSLVLGFYCIPITILQLLIPGSSEEALFHSGTIHWKPAVVVGFAIFWLPLACRMASKFTHRFEDEDEGPTYIRKGE